MIQLKSVIKQYGEKHAVNDVSFVAREGDIVGFLGPNGAGKTTTMRLIIGYLTPTSGSVEVNGYNPVDSRIAVLKHIGYLPENNPLFHDMKVGEYLAFISAIKHVGKDEVAHIGERVAIGDVHTTRIDQLSRGYKQRVGLAAALLGNPEILILDEPTSGLDPIEQEKIKDLIKEIAKNKTIIFSTHILSEVEDVASRLIIINKGSLVYDDKKPTGKGSVEKLFRKIITP